MLKIQTFSVYLQMIMNSELSILIPVRNDICVNQVRQLQRQAEDIPGLDYEVIVMDDGSTDKTSIKLNQAIGDIPHCRFIRHERNVGRSATRNRLAREAGKKWLLFLDCNLCIPSPHFVANYLNCGDTDVVCGGTTVETGPTHNLRYRYERHAMHRLTARCRQANPYHHFRSNNFLIRRQVLLAHPFHEEIKQYGFEDVLLGKELAESGVSIRHIDNPVVLSQFEPNDLFLSKTEESLRTLHSLEERLYGYSTLLHYAQLLRKAGLRRPMRTLLKLCSKGWRKKLTEEDGSLLLFKLYKLGYYLSIDSLQPQKTSNQTAPECC